MKRATLGWLSAAIGLRIVANLAARHLGFVAISDDDYARVVIAQHFAHTPAWDPSGTSWLPFPFWLTGGVMAFTRPSLEVAHLLAWVTSLVCVPAFYVAARWNGQSPRWASWSSCVFAVFPQAVWCGLATVPEGYAAVLAALALASCNRPALNARLLGVVCVTAASLSRYELWPIALVVAAAQQLTPPGARGKRATAWLLTSAALSGPTAWLLHGLVNHGAPLFFLSKVANYRTMVGQAPEAWLDLVTNYPVAFVRKAPLLSTLGVLTLLSRKWGTGAAPLPPEDRRALVYPLVGASAVVVFLLIGDANNGAPTHHPERALQLCWLVLLSSVGVVLQHVPWLASTLGRRLSLCVLPIAALGLLRTDAQRFVNREAEIALGQAFARRLNDEERLVVETKGYGYVALAAATAQPWNVVGLNPDDPRQSSPSWNTKDELRTFFTSKRIRWLIVPEARRAGAQAVATPMGTCPLGVILRVQ